MNVGCAALDCIEQHLVDESDDRSILDFVARVILVLLFGAADVEVFEIEIVVVEATHAGVDRLDRLDDAILQFVLLDNDRVDTEAGCELYVVDSLQVGRIGDAEKQTLATFDERQDAML